MILIEQLKEKWSLVIPSVLLDAGAGMQWKYYDKEHKEYFSKSEGLALASLDMYKAGHFATAESLLKINADTIKKYLKQRKVPYVRGLFNLVDVDRQTRCRCLK